MTGIDRVRRLLLISNSTLHGSDYLDHVEAEIKDFLGKTSRTVFVPFAVSDRGAYAEKAKERFRQMGFELESIHDVSNMRRAIEQADAIFIGGGNTFRLLKGLYDHDVLTPIRESRIGDALYRLECWLHRGLSDVENNQGHASCATALVRSAWLGSIPDQPALPRPRPIIYAYGRNT